MAVEEVCRRVLVLVSAERTSFRDIDEHASRDQQALRATLPRWHTN